MDTLRGAPACRERLLSNITNGIVAGSDYSGMRTAEASLEACVALAPLPGTSPAIKHLWSCDNSTASMKICLDGRNPALHHFDDINSRIPASIRNVFDGMESEFLDSGSASSGAADPGRPFGAAAAHISTMFALP